MLGDVFRQSRLQWGGNGPGSSWEKTERVREELPLLLRHLAVKSVLDYGCGDPSWIGQIILETDIQYIGVDVVQEVIERAHQAYPQEQFLLMGSLADELPRADLVIVRDCFAHLSLEDVCAAIAQIAASGADWLLATSCRPQSSNLNGTTGGFRPLNLKVSPFGFPEPERWIDELCDDKSLGLWRMKDAVPRGWF